MFSSLILSNKNNFRIISRMSKLKGLLVIITITLFTCTMEKDTSKNRDQVPEQTYEIVYKNIPTGSISSNIKEQLEAIRSKIREMMKHAWDNYVQYAWGQNELRPVSKREYNSGIFGNVAFGATILHGMDTLYIMGLQKEFEKARNWVANELDLSKKVNCTSSWQTSDVFVFEVITKLVGGLLSSYALTGDAVFQNKAQEIIDKLLPAFNTPTGIPHSVINFEDGFSKNYGWVVGGASILGEIGGLHLEMTYLSDITGNPVYRTRVDQIRKILAEIKKPDGFYYNYLNPTNAQWGQQVTSLGAGGKHFYEYLLKAWLQSNRENVESRKLFDEAMTPILQHLLKTSDSKSMYFGNMLYGIVENKMEHIACSSGGMLALASATLNNNVSSRYMEVAKEIARTCHKSYIQSETKLGPQTFRFTEQYDCKAMKSEEKNYFLRPETVETYFYLYRLTKDNLYRLWGLEVLQALEDYCKVPNGYRGLTNVYTTYNTYDIQDSTFLGETLKYLYLLYSDDQVISLDEWVLNTQGHPLPIKNHNGQHS